MLQKWKIENIAMIAPIPALLIGAIVMSGQNISPYVYGQNFICYLILTLLLRFLITKPINIVTTKVEIVLPIFVCIAIACSFLNDGLENVHRWLAIGSFRLYISSIVLPCLIIMLGILLKKERTVFPITITVLVMIMLTLQPDASQTSAFAVSMTFLVWIHVKQQLLKYGVALWSISSIVFSWTHIDGLSAVAHVEDILFLASDMGIVWLSFGIISLALLFVPFLCFPDASKLAKAICLYYASVLVSTFFGNFPVMFMGFGISPIIGYQLAIFFLISEKSQRASPNHIGS